MCDLKKYSKSDVLSVLKHLVKDMSVDLEDMWLNEGRFRDGFRSALHSVERLQYLLETGEVQIEDFLKV